jgi:hypothetical protein
VVLVMLLLLLLLLLLRMKLSMVLGVLTAVHGVRLKH